MIGSAGCVIGFVLRVRIKRQRCVSSNYSSVFAPDVDYTAEFLLMTSQWYVKELIHRDTEGTKKASNSFDQEPLERPVYLPCPAIAPPSSHYLPGSSVTVDCHFEGSLAEKQAYSWNGEEYTKGGRCTHIFYYRIACVDC
jgi:hypothetical protein